jgi:hypothetical protein
LLRYNKAWQAHRGLQCSQGHWWGSKPSLCHFVASLCFQPQFLNP